MKVNFVTSNENKAREVNHVLGGDYEVVRLKTDLPEIQSLDLHEIIGEKLRVACERFPDQLLIVEDTSFEVDALNGLPGTLVKFFQSQVGDQGIYEMARGRQPEGDLPARAMVTIGLVVDGVIKYFDGVVEGRLVAEMGDGWGFDNVLIPDGYDQRMSFLVQDLKAEISHRAMATKALKQYLDSLKH